MKDSKGCTLLHYIAMNADILQNNPWRYPIDAIELIDIDSIQSCFDTIIDGIIDQTIIITTNTTTSGQP